MNRSVLRAENVIRRICMIVLALGSMLKDHHSVRRFAPACTVIFFSATLVVTAGAVQLMASTFLVLTRKDRRTLKLARLRGGQGCCAPSMKSIASMYFMLPPSGGAGFLTVTDLLCGAFPIAARQGHGGALSRLLRALGAARDGHPVLSREPLLREGQDADDVV